MNVSQYRSLTSYCGWHTQPSHVIIDSDICWPIFYPKLLYSTSKILTLPLLCDTTACGTIIKIRFMSITFC